MPKLRTVSGPLRMHSFKFVLNLTTASRAGSITGRVVLARPQFADVPLWNADEVLYIYIYIVYILYMHI